MVEPIVLNANIKLYGELGELARYLESAMRKVSEIGAPLASDNAALPQATAHLLDLNKMTEEGTLEVMRLTEMIQDNHARAAKELAVVVSALEAVDSRALAAHLRMTAQELAQDDKHLMDIMTALSFQDLVAQRVKKLVTIVEDVQCKLVELVVVFGLEQEAAVPETKGKAGEMLRQLEASKSTAIKQDLADELLSEFGFK
jgi:chemotaxis protein CheZ